MSNWYEHIDCEKTPIISSRVRLARNLLKYPFSVQQSNESIRAMIEEIHAPLSNDFDFIVPTKDDAITCLRMVESHEISPEILKLSTERPFALLKNDSANIMLGEEDHIRIQAVVAGDNLDRAYAAANEIDDKLDKIVNYAYHKDLGYLTSCPTNTGTGLRASFMVHIPMIEKSGALANLVRHLSKLGLTVRGIYGEGTKPCGSIYQVSNQVTLGKSEAEIIEKIKTVGSQLIESERTLLESSFTTSRLEIEDVIHRAIGLLTHARRLTLNEAMESLSAIRVGLLSGVIKEVNLDLPIYCVMINIQPGSLQKMAGKHLSDNDILIERAKYLRKVFSGQNF